ncbi:SUMF1/EgtB/PvdO family nonheme iron enzyme [Hyphococcus sp.]|uniref:SUMF1/EgtB/PvdO family nonheme iron enzyme n=1 Tax=Hyphococcus sp. TaxID=2038636 RepID=UPI00208C848C|nr:MAG: hypothetical protein DHS20C04_03050 [Marinicaulis sp.]
MSSVSILHAPKDEALGEKIAAALASAGLHASRPGDGTGGHDDAAIIVWTEAAAKLVQLHEQALSAMTRGALVPVAVGGVLPPDEFESLPPVDLSGWTGSSDDPRWRFVLEEIQLTKQRLGLRDGVVWSAAESEADPVDLEAENDLEISAQLKRALPPNDAPPAFLTPASTRRRFSAKEVAIGATAGLVALTVATALLAPILLPAPKAVPPLASTQKEPAVQIPDPPEQSASALASLSVSGTEADVPLTDDAPAAPALESAATNRDAIKDLIAAVDAETIEAGSAAAASPEPATAQAVVGDAFKVNTFKDCAQCPEMASLPAGSFQMGAAPGESAKAKSESPRRQVAIGKSFALGTREITYAQWDACVADGGCTMAPPDHGWGRGDRPVVSVSFDDARSYVAWLSEKTGQSYRLPSEAEWEYAARAGSDAAFATGAGISTAQANYNGQFPYRGAKEIFRQRTVPVASFPANAFGLFDMNGNAWEWTADCWKASHAGAPADQSAVVDGDCAKRVLKGGAWNTGAWRLRSAHRIGKAKTAREFDNGFRVAKDLGS